MSRAVKTALAVALLVLAVILVSQCAFSVGEWAGRN